MMRPYNNAYTFGGNMKKVIAYLSMSLWLVALFVGIITISRGEHITSLTAIAAILSGFIYAVGLAIDAGTDSTKQDILTLKLVNENARIPTVGSNGAAGYDLYSCEKASIIPGETTVIHTGICVAIPEGQFAGIYARSGIATKKGLRPANCVGVIDSDYRGEIMVALHNDSSELQEIKTGDRIAQMIIQPYAQLELKVASWLDQTERGTGGFGHTGT